MGVLAEMALMARGQGVTDRGVRLPLTGVVVEAVRGGGGGPGAVTAFPGDGGCAADRGTHSHHRRYEPHGCDEAGDVSRSGGRGRRGAAEKGYGTRTELPVQRSADELWGGSSPWGGRGRRWSAGEVVAFGID